MKLKIRGQIHIQSTRYAIILDNLNFEILTKSYSGRINKIKSIKLTGNGEFDTEIELIDSFGSLYNMLAFYDYNGKSKNIIEFGPYCGTKDIEINYVFNPKEHLIWYDHVQSQIRQVIGDGDFSKVEPEQFNLLACEACVEYVDLVEMRKAYILRNEVIRKAKECIDDAGNNLVKEQENQQYYAQLIQSLNWLISYQKLRAALFVLVENNSDQGLNKILTLSQDDLRNKLLSASENKRADISKTDCTKLAEAFSYIRNCMLFNVEYDNNYHDAKLIHISSFDAMAKHHLLNLSLSSGGIKSILDKEEKEILRGIKPKKINLKTLGLKQTPRKKAYKSSFNKEELIQLVEYDKVTMHFTPMLSIVASELRNKQWNPDTILKYDIGKWQKLIKEQKLDTKYPSIFNGLENPIETYAQEIQDSLSSLHSDKLALITLNNSKVPGKTALANILKNAAGFDISKDAVSRYFKVSDKADGRSNISSENYQRLQEYQRVTKLVGGLNNPELINALYENKFTSSAQIIHRGWHEFESAMETIVVEAILLDQIYCRARSRYDFLNEMATRYIQTESTHAALPAFLSSYTAFMVEAGSNQTTVDESIDIPNLESLFGSMDQCNCKHCQSVYSPAAYLTDILHWMSDDLICMSSNVSAYQVLDNRRPDIKYIQLNCKNTNTVLPYIDLVNELLLAYVIPSPSITLLESLQTTKTSEELLLRPEHLDNPEFDAAKGELRKAHYHWSLPYDLNWDRSRSYLDGLNLNDYLLSERLGISKDEKWWVNARLGLLQYQLNSSSALIYPDFDLLTSSTTPANLWIDYYGSATPITKLDQLMAASDLSFEDIIALSKVAYIKGSTRFSINAGDECDLSEMDLIEFNEDVAFRLLKFVKLMLRTGLSIEVLDLSLSGLGISTIDNDVLTDLAQLLDLSEGTGLDLEHVLCLVNDLSIYSSSLPPQIPGSFYKKKFLARKETELIFGEEKLDIGDDIADLNSQEKTAIATTFNFNLDQLNKFLPTTGIWNIASVTHLAKAELLFKLSGLGFDDFYSLIEIYYADDINSISSLEDVYDFKERCDKILNFELKLSEISSMLNGSDSWSLDLSSIDLTNIMGEDLTSTFTSFEGEWNTLGTIAFSLKLNTLAKHLAVLINLEESYTQLIVAHNETYYSTLTVEQLFVSAYRFLKRFKSIEKELALDCLEQYLSSPFTTNNVSDYFKWIEDDFSLSSIDDLLNLAWLKRLSDFSNKIGVIQHDFLVLINGFKGLASVNSTQVNNRAISLYGYISNEDYLLSNSETEFTLACKKSYSTVRDKDYLEIAIQANRILELSRTLNTSVEECWSIVFKNDTFTGTHQFYGLSLSSGLLQDALDTSLDSAAGIAVENIIRINLRDRLLSYHLTQSILNFENSNAVFAHFLLDPEMDACMKTSRVKLALSGVQLLIHRAIFGLEADLCPSANNVKQWEWRQNYRVWEANRKVFLYPENWIDPTLRIEKSEFYAELEDTILQDEITDENCEKAVAQYLQKLNQVARLDIRALHTEIEEKVGGSILHVFGRTFSTPYEYYYRRRELNKRWTPWEKLELDIEGEHIIPTMFNRRLYLIWPMFIEKEHRKIKRVIDGEEQNSPYLEVKLCYSKLEFGKWSSKKIFDATLLAGHYGGLGCFNNIRYKLGQDVPQVIVGHDFSMGFPFGHTPVYGPQEYDNGSLVLSNARYQDYAKVSLEKNAFYFWPQIDHNHDLIIHVRRDFHSDWDDKHYAYTEMAYEDSFKISACDESAELIPPVITEVKDTYKRFLARPYRTLPMANRMLEGLDNKKQWDDTEGVYVKDQITHGGPAGPEILRSANSPYYLTYPVGDKHSLSHLPFFLTDKRHTLFFERLVEEKCRKRWIIKPTENFPGYYQAQYYTSISDKYHVEEHEHPYICKILSEFNRGGIIALFKSSDPILERQLGIERYFQDEYDPVNAMIDSNYPVKQFDFDHLAAYGIYNMETFFHTPSLIARQLKSNGKYADAIKWLQFIFDPTNRDMDLGSKRYWMIKPFVQNVSNSSIQNLMALLGASALSPSQERERNSVLAQIEEWEDNPFEPHRIAEMRMRAYMLWTVYEYIDVLIEWGDSLFSQDTMESISQATNLYILASEILGRRPIKVDREESAIGVNYNNIRNGLDDFSNTLQNLENEFPNYNPAICCRSDRPSLRDQSLPDLLFCIPDNPKILEFWDKVEDRLFKIRHCMNIEGQLRDLALWQPPIDPGLLVRARAMGISIGDILADINSPDPIYRFSYLIQKPKNIQMN